MGRWGSSFSFVFISEQSMRPMRVRAVRGVWSRKDEMLVWENGKVHTRAARPLQH